MYHVHSVTAFVCRTYPRGEANATADLVTDGMGFLRVTAQGIRYAKSKSRYAVQELSFIECELVRGKESWRMIKARPVESAYSKLSLEASKAMTRVARLA